MSSSDTNALWKRFAAGDDVARERLIEKHMGLVHEMARRMAGRLSDQVRLEDLVSAGTMGLIRALDQFEASRGVAFSTYAVPKIRGAILDDLRAKDPASRSLRKREREIRDVTQRLSQVLGREPTDQEVAEELQVDIRLLWRWRDGLQALQSMPLDSPVSGGDESATLSEVVADADGDNAEDDLIKQERREALAAAIKGLKPQERLVLSLYYYEELKQSEIAQVLEVSESRVSQIRSKALKALRKSLAA